MSTNNKEISQERFFVEEFGLAAELLEQIFEDAVNKSITQNI
jgi:hypothetical protein